MTKRAGKLVTKSAAPQVRPFLRNRYIDQGQQASTTNIVGGERVPWSRYV
jgi:hypothetical protein